MADDEHNDGNGTPGSDAHLSAAKLATLRIVGHAFVDAGNALIGLGGAVDLSAQAANIREHLWRVAKIANSCADALRDPNP